MVKQGSSECVVNGILMHVSCIKAHWVDEHNAVEGNRYKLQTKATVIDHVLRRHVVPFFFTSSEKHLPV
jgi:hypothetical protein